MDINFTLIGQFLTFAILIAFTMKLVWPPILKTIHDREKKIAAGLEAAERSKRELEAAEHQASTILRDARQQATVIIEQANVQSAQLIDQAKQQAKEENKRIVSLAQDEIAREALQAREGLKTHLASLVISGTEKIIQSELNPALHHDLLNKLAAEI